MADSAPTHSPVVVWFRRDLRLGDNAALARAVASGAPVIALYIRDPADAHAGANGAAQGWWLHHSLAALDQSLKARGNRLLTLTGEPRHVLGWLVAETGASAVFWNRRYDPAGMALDSEIKAGLRDQGLTVESFPGFLMHDPAQLQTKQGRKFSVYTPFWKAFAEDYVPAPALPAPASIPAGGIGLDPEPLADWGLLPRNPDWATGFASIWAPGEDGARKRLDAFLVRALNGYGANRDQPGVEGTSRLSPHLAFGELAPATIWRATLEAEITAPDEDLVKFRKEVVWREFAWHTLFHHPDLGRTNLDRRFDSFAWHGTDAQFADWARGRTGYPIVDAGMRELWHTGSMHNRVRMITASFLIKDLLIDWRRGADWFSDTLVDADQASNAFSWQWVAGCGADAAPFFRIFNPVLQGRKFDPQGGYVRKWCPELARLPDEFVHCPWDAPAPVLRQADLALGRDYPRPIVDHAVARDRALAALAATRGEPQEPV